MAKTLSFIKTKLKKLGIKKGDKIVFVLDFLKLSLFAKKNKEKIIPDEIIDLVITIIGKEGTLVFNSFCWDFIKKNYYDYSKSKSIGGALSNRSLERNDFVRTQHPIYSFSVYGKDSKKMKNIKSIDSFGSSSVFGYMVKNNFKYIGVGVELNSGFAFVHVAEQKAKVEYRYIKKFYGIFIDENNKSLKKESTMFVRKINLSKGTRSKKSFYNLLLRKKILKENYIENLKIYSFDLLKVFNIMVRDLKTKRKYIISL